MRHLRQPKWLPAESPGNEMYDLAADPGEHRSPLGGKPKRTIVDLAAAFCRPLRVHLGENKGQAEPIRLDDETIRELRSLGHIDE